MKDLFLSLSILIASISLAQDGEFTIHQNGLIYGEQTMTNLSRIVDSLNLEFKTCYQSKTFKSKYQILGTKVKLKNHRVKEAMKDLEKNISLTSFKTKYPKAEIIEGVLIVRFEYFENDALEAIEYSEISLGDYYGQDLRFKEELVKHDVNNMSNWVYKYYSKSSYSEEQISAFYMPAKMKSTNLPQYYSDMVSYSECLIDTTTTKFKKEMEFGRVELPTNWQKLSRSEQDNLLDELRGTRVIGSCSQDDSPRRHAVNIAMLSAETENWKVFLRAHLDVMNDRFERVSDGSYAWNARKTYIRELEELNINVSDLILGIALRLENPSDNHYFGNIRRIGRSLTETRNKEEIESELFGIIENEKLDLYNRIIGYYVVSNYMYNHELEEDQERIKVRLKTAVKSLPPSISKRIVI